jgi:hypothetical protein
MIETKQQVFDEVLGDLEWEMEQSHGKGNEWHGYTELDSLIAKYSDRYDSAVVHLGDQDCQYCHNLRTIFYPNDFYDELWIGEDGALTVNDFEVGAHKLVKLNYCPFCGRMLEGIHDTEISSMG